MVAHAIDLQTQIGAAADGEPTGAVRYRWRCSCGEHAKRWYSSGQHGQHAGRAARRARDGGARHVAAMDRGR